MHQLEKKWRTSGEKYMEKISTKWRGGLDKKPVPTIPSMEWSPICEKDVAEALRTTLN